MVSHMSAHHDPEKLSNGSRRPQSSRSAHRQSTPGSSLPQQARGTPGSAHPRAPKPSTVDREREKPPSKDGAAQRAAQDVAGLQDYVRGPPISTLYDTATRLRTEASVSAAKQLGDCLGKGAFGSVYRALNWGTGETVAIKQVKLVDLPKNELRVIMLEIDLLKNLNHPNIVKYHGFVKGTQSLYIILEYCENGSLHSICKNFGKFPENLVAIYMSQVLHGLLYLHEQGVIHRDIKGANILTTKEGLVKLADFGVATKTAGLNDSSVVGTPYWMAPEVIELSGATTASDIWSLGCTVIELLEGKPPYYKLQPMPALFRIVNDDHPPLPEAASPAVRDFLMQCFQKDPNLRVSARKLLKHPWIVNARRADSVVPTKPTKYDEAVKSVQEWNEALKSPTTETLRRASRAISSSPVPPRKESLAPIVAPVPPPGGLHVQKTRPTTELFASSPDEETDNWDDDFASSISPSALKLPHLRPHDNFAGLLSSEKLKAYASSFDTLTEEPGSENGFGQALTADSPPPVETLDGLETIRPSSGSTQRHDSSKSSRMNQGALKGAQEPKTQFFRGMSKAAVVPPINPRISSFTKPTKTFRENSVEDYSDLIAADDAAFQKKLQSLKDRNNKEYAPRLFHPSDLTNVPRSAQSGKRSSNSQRNVSAGSSTGKDLVRRAASPVPQTGLGIEKYAEHEEEDFSDVFGNDGAAPALKSKYESDDGSERGTLRMLNSKLSASWLGDEEDEEDPFAQLEEGFDEMDQETNVARDRYARLCSLVENRVSSLKSTQPVDVLYDVSDELLQILLESPEIKSVIVSSHGMLPILEILESMPHREIIANLLKIVNIIIFDNVEIQENLCFVGGIPIITQFAHKKFPFEIRQEAAAFVRQMYQTSTLTLQMFIGCGGLNVLVEFLEEDLEDDRDFVLIGVNGVWSVFNLQGPTPKNDFCRIFSRSSVLYPLSLVLSKVLEEDGEVAELIEERIVGIFMLFSQAETHVKELVADRMVLKRVLKDLQRMRPANQITMLKFIKNLSMLTTTHEALQNSNAIEVLTDLLSSSMKLPHFREVSNQILNILYNLCRLSKPRQEDAALNGVIPLLQTIVKTEWPLKEFALPILCDMAHSGKVGRKVLWQNKGLQFYISLLYDKYWQVTALDAIFIWLQEETARVEQALISGSFANAIIACFTHQDSSVDAFENLLEPLQKLLRLSPPAAALLAHPELFSRVGQKLHTRKPVVRLNLLRIIRSICDATEERGGGAPLIQAHGLLEAIKRLAESDPAILVREMANELVKACESPALLSPTSARRNVRPSSSRRQSVTFTPLGFPPPVPPLPSGMSSNLPPPTPPMSAVEYRRTGTFWDGGESPRATLLLGASKSFDNGLPSLKRPGSSRSNHSRPISRQGSSESASAAFARPNRPMTGESAPTLFHRPITRDSSGDNSVPSYSRPRTREGSGNSDHRVERMSAYQGEASDALEFRPHTRDGSSGSTSTAVSNHSHSREYRLSKPPSSSSITVTDHSSHWAAGDDDVHSATTPTSESSYPDGGRGSVNSNKASRLPVNVRPSSRRQNLSYLSNGNDGNSSPSSNPRPPPIHTHSQPGTNVSDRDRSSFVVGTPPNQVFGGPGSAGFTTPYSSRPSNAGTPYHQGHKLAVRRRRQTSSGYARKGSRQDDLVRESGHSGLVPRRGSRQDDLGVE